LTPPEDDIRRAQDDIYEYLKQQPWYPN
jgi:hypothetical protein